uniref:Uncharacterized protein n=1 Tax=Glossina pallidipes TaxID=7398 RepID=A0A1B0A3J7_GLOPL
MFSNLFIKYQFHTSLNTLVRRAKKLNPGLGHLAYGIEDVVDVIESDPEGFDKLEADFMQAGQSYHQHKLDLEKQRERIRHFMVKHKYFRDDTLPNLLTYAEKEHIRLLHSRDAEEWSVERLAESFPATAEIIKKILRANWRPLSAKRVHSHDLLVLENWHRYKKGEFEKQLPPELKEHLKKFVDRRLEDLKALHELSQTFTPIQLPKPKIQEFQSIITSCAKYKDADTPTSKTLPPRCANERKTAAMLRDGEPIESFKNPFGKDAAQQEPIESSKNPFGRDAVQQKASDITVEIINNEMVISAANSNNKPRKETLPSYPTYDNEQLNLPILNKHNEEEETYLLSKTIDKRKMRLEEAKKMKLSELEHKEETGTGEVDEKEIDNLANLSNTGIIQRETSLDFTDKFSSSEVVISAEDSKRFAMSTVKDRIYIPRKLRRKGATYRLEDCYYDYDGEFLYRVPGMTGV